MGLKRIPTQISAHKRAWAPRRSRRPKSIGRPTRAAIGELEFIINSMIILMGQILDMPSHEQMETLRVSVDNLAALLQKSFGFEPGDTISEVV